MRRTSAVTAAVLLASYAFFHNGGGFNQNTRFDLVRAIVERGTVAIDAFHENTLDKATRDGHYFCDKPPGVSFLGVPAYFAAYHAIRLAGGDPAAPAAQAWAAHLTAVAAVSVLGALLGALFLRTVAPYSAPGQAFLTTAGLGLGTLLFPYATVLYGHVPAAALLFAAFAAAFGARRRAATSLAPFALAGLAAGTAIAVEYEVLLVVALLGLYVLTGPASWRAAAAFALGALAPVVALSWYHAVCFGSPLSTGFAHEALPFWQVRYGEGVYGLHRPEARALYQLTVGPWRGLFYQAPWLVLAFPGLVALARRGWWPEAVLVAAVFGVMLVFNASLQSWDGGWTMGARYLIPAVPFLSFAAASATGRVARAATIVLVPVSVLFMLAGAAVMPEVPVLVPNPLTDLLLPRLFAGQLPLANPGATAFNVGERLGLQGLASLGPLLVLWLAGGAAIALLARREARTPALRGRPGTPSAPGAPSRSSDAA